MIGCQSPWDASLHFKACTTANELAQYEFENHEMQHLEQTEITEYTGCLLPCRYREFKLVDTPFDGFEEKLGLVIMFGSGTTIVAKEAEIYPLSSFIAEFGGCLGLFLGFSFIMVYDFFQTIIWKIKKIVGSSQSVDTRFKTFWRGLDEEGREIKIWMEDLV